MRNSIIHIRNHERSLKALANRRRLTIIKYLKTNQEAAVGDIAAAINLSLRSTSKHLAILAAADIVERDQKSRQMLYRLSDVPAPVAKAVIHLV